MGKDLNENPIGNRYVNWKTSEKTPGAKWQPNADGTAAYWRADGSVWDTSKTTTTKSTTTTTPAKTTPTTTKTTTSTTTTTTTSTTIATTKAPSNGKTPSQNNVKNVKKGSSSKNENINVSMTIPLAAPVDFSKQAEVDKMAKSIKDALHKELAKDNPFGPQGNTTVEVMVTKKNMRKRRASVPASANIKVQYTAPAGTKQIHDSKTIASKMAKSTKVALNTPEMKKIVD